MRLEIPFIYAWTMGVICRRSMCVPRRERPVTAYVKIVGVIGGAALNHLAHARCS